MSPDAISRDAVSREATERHSGPSLAAIQGQEGALNMLRRTLETGRVPSAFLFSGPRHVGKRTTALAYAKALNCKTAPGEGCGACPSCRKIDESLHPDVDVIVPDGQFIRIQQVREVDRRLALIPFEATKRVIIVSEADRMHDESANAFLKTLEEPPGDTLIVLCAEHPLRLPETVRSRCMRIRFAPLDEPTLRRLWGAQPGEGGEDDPPAGAHGADPSGPRPGGAEISSQQVDFALRFAQGQLRPEAAPPAERLLSVRAELLEALERLEGGGYEMLSERIGRWSNSDDWRLMLELLETWLHDLVLLHHGGTARLIHVDCRERLERWMKVLPARQAESCYRQVLEVREHLLLNVNKPLALDALWLGMRRAAPHDGGGSHP